MNARARTLILAAALTALSLAAVAAFLVLRMWEQPVWSEVGRRRFLLSAAVAALLAVTLYPLRSRLLGAVLAAAAILYTGIVAGPLATAGVIYWLCGAWCLGRVVLRRLRLPVNPSAVFFGLPVGLALVAFVVGTTASLPIHRTWLHLLWPGICIALEARSLRALLSRLGDVPWHDRVSPASYLAAALGSFLVFAHWQAALMPETSADGLAMHLNVAAWVAAHGSFHFDVTRGVWAVMPMGGDWLFTSAYLVGGEAAARLANLAFLLLLAGLVYSLARRWLTNRLALLAASLFLSTPVAYFVTGSLFVENVWTLFLLAAVAAVERWRDDRAPRWLAVAAALAGSALASKLGALPCLLALGVGAAVALAGEKQFRGGLAWAAVVFVLFAAPPYLNAMARTGNPIFPYLNNVFRSPFFDSTRAFRDPRYPPYLHPDLLYRMTFHSRQFLEGREGGSGFHLFVLWPLVLLALRRRQPFWITTAAIAAPLILLLVFAAQSYLRYVYPLSVLVAVLIAWLISEARAYHPWLGRSVTAAALMCALGNTWFLAASGWYNTDFVLGLARDRERYLTERAPERQLVDYLNRTAEGEPAAFLEGDAVAGFLGRAYTDTWHTEDFTRALAGASSPVEVWQEFQERGIRFAIARVESDRPAARFTTVEALMAVCGELVQRAGRLAAVRLQAGCGPASFENHSPGVAAPGAYDDFSPLVDYTGSWYHDSQFGQAAGGTLTYTNHPGSAFTLRFMGEEIAWVFTKAYNRGRARVTLDGREVATIDLHSPDIEWQRRASFRAQGDGPHVFRVEILREKNPASSDTAVDLDLLEVGAPGR